MSRLWRNRYLSIVAKIWILKNIVPSSPSVIFTSELLMMNANKRRKIKVFDMKCLNNPQGLSVMDQVMIRDIKEDVKREVFESVYKGILKRS